MFVRIKTVNNRPYGYLVKNEWTPWGSRQRVTKYLGRVHQPERVSDDITPLPSGFTASIHAAIDQELRNHGFLTEGTCLTKGSITVNLDNGTVRQRKKHTVIQMNEGFLCDHTLQQLLAFTPKERADKSAKALANHALEAGLRLTEEQFVHLYEHANTFKKHQEEAQTS